MWGSVPSKKGCASQIAFFSPDPNRPREATIPLTLSPGCRKEERPAPEEKLESGGGGRLKAGGSTDPSEGRGPESGGLGGPGPPGHPARAHGPESRNLVRL